VLDGCSDVVILSHQIRAVIRYGLHCAVTDGLKCPAVAPKIRDPPRPGAQNSAIERDPWFPVRGQVRTTGCGFVALRLVYLIFIRPLGALALLLRSDVSEEAEILVLRPVQGHGLHQAGRHRRPHGRGQAAPRAPALPQQARRRQRLLALESLLQLGQPWVTSSGVVYESASA
jgi:hypothetical protein